MFITGPDVVKTVTGEDVTLEELGGALTHATKSGVASFVAPDEKSCLDQVRQLLAYLPANNVSMPAVLPTADDPDRPVPELADLVPGSSQQPHDMKELVRAVLDDGEFFEYHALWALNIVCGFGRIGGRAVGVVANQPQVLAGVLDIDAAEKGARFVRTCDCFNIPVITLVDVPGFMPGTDQEHGGMARRGAKLLYAYCEATVPKIQLIVRRAYGAAYVVMGSKSLGADLAYAWPGAELAVVGPESAVDLLYSSARTGRRLQGSQCQPVPGGRARLHRRRHRAGQHAPRPAPGAGNAGQQTPGSPGAQARQHTAVSKA
jgi:acetyl-CoA carboxylase carboxyltransferase component